MRQCSSTNCSPQSLFLRMNDDDEDDDDDDDVRAAQSSHRIARAAQDAILKLAAADKVVASLTRPTLVCTRHLTGRRVESFAFSKSLSAALVLTTFSEVPYVTVTASCIRMRRQQQQPPMRIYVVTVRARLSPPLDPGGRSARS